VGQRRSLVETVLVFGLPLALTACGQAKGKEPETVPARTVAAPVGTPAAPHPVAEPRMPAAAASQPILASQEYSLDPDLRCDVLEVRRVSGGALLIKWRLTHVPTAAATGLQVQEPKKIYHNWPWEGVYVTEPVENKKYLGLRDSNGTWIAQGSDKWYAPGERQAMWMKFPAPPEGSNRITFVYPGFAPFEDLSVAP